MLIWSIQELQSSIVRSRSGDREGTFGDGHPFTNEEDEDGFKFDGGDLRFTSKGMVNSIEPMPDGVPKVRK